MNTDDRAVTVMGPGQLAHINPMDSLALMSDDEFDRKLAILKVGQERMERIQREIMTPDVDYGLIPGTSNKKTLLKPGAEKLCKFHHLVPTFAASTILGDGIATPHIRVLITCSLHYETEDGPIVGQGLGACNSWEKKYRWRNGQRLCPSCGAAAIYRSKFPDKQTRDKGWYCFDKKGGCGAQFASDDPEIVDQQQGEVANPDPFDGENTYTKMAAKRAQVDAILRATGTSGIWAQDLEDLDPADINARPAQTQTTAKADDSAGQVPIHDSPQRPSRPAKPAPVAPPASPISEGYWRTWDKLVSQARQLGIYDQFGRENGLDFERDTTDDGEITEKCVDRPSFGGQDGLIEIGKALKEIVRINTERKGIIAQAWQPLFDRARELGIDQLPVLRPSDPASKQEERLESLQAIVTAAEAGQEAMPV